MTPDFDPTIFLSTLHNRFQTLEDLRTELRTRSQDLNKELLDLVNENYQDFLSLGSSLKGGDEKIEEVRLGLLAFKREVQGLRGKVEDKKVDVGRLIEEKKSIRNQVQRGRGLLEVDRRLEELEERLMLTSKEAQKSDDVMELSESDDESEEEMSGGICISGIRRHAEQYLYIQKLIEKLGPDHPFLIQQEERLLRLKQTILLDLGSALKQAAAINDEDKANAVKILAIYRTMDQSKDAVAVLKELRINDHG